VIGDDYGTWAASHPDAVVVTTSEGIVVHWNRAATVLFGYEASEVLDRNLSDLVVPAHEEAQHRQSLTDAMGGEVIAYECVRLRKDRTMVWVDVSARRFEIKGRSLILFSKRDMTRRVAEADSRKVEARFRDLLESVPDAVVIVNQTGAIVIANAAVEEMFGYAPGELTGGEVEALIPSHLRQQHLHHRESFAQEPRKRSMGSKLDLSGRRKDGTELPIEVSLSPLNAEGRSFVMCAIRDVSDRRMIEQHLHEKNVALAAAVHARDEFFAGMSHELRTPLNAIIGFTGTLLMQLPGPLNDEQRRQLGMVQVSGKHLLSLINDLLEIARLDADKSGLRLKSVSVFDVINEVVETLGQEAERKNLALRERVEPRHLSALGDRRAMTQILLNLVGNALKFSQHGTVDVEAVPRSSDGEQVVISVSDMGPGMTVDAQDRLFSAFSRPDSDGVAGTGLGLFISRKLAHAMGGRLECESAPGLGSTFRLTLRAA
jgi:PAS domain S-box-containing protein